jgi:hypothetical protein
MQQACQLPGMMIALIERRLFHREMFHLILEDACVLRSRRLLNNGGDPIRTQVKGETRLITPQAARARDTEPRTWRCLNVDAVSERSRINSQGKGRE